MANTEFAVVVAACRSALNNQDMRETAVSFLQKKKPEKVAGFVRQYLAEQKMRDIGSDTHLSSPEDVADYRSKGFLPSVSFIKGHFAETYAEFSEKFVRDLEGLKNPFHLLNNLWSVARIAHTRKMSRQEGNFIRSVMNSTFMLLKHGQDPDEGLYGFNRRNKSGDFRNPAPFFRLTKKESPVAAIRSLDLFLDRDWCAVEGSLSESLVEAYEAALVSFADDLMKDPGDLVDQDIRNVIYPAKKPKSAEGQSPKDASSEFGAKLGDQENALGANTDDRSEGDQSEESPPPAPSGDGEPDADADADADVGADADANADVGADVGADANADANADVGAYTDTDADADVGGQSEDGPLPAPSGDGEPDGSSSDKSPTNQEEAS